MPNESTVGMELRQSSQVWVPPADSVSVPLGTEGAPQAAVQVFLEPGSRVRPSLDGQPMTRGSDFLAAEVYGASLNGIVDPRVELVNGGTKPAAAMVMVFVTSGREVTVTTDARVVEPGEPVGISVSVSESTPGDAPLARLLGPDGVATPVELTPAGPGLWRGEVVPTTPGGYRIVASTPGSRLRAAFGLFSVSSLVATFGEGGSPIGWREWKTMASPTS